MKKILLILFVSLAAFSCASNHPVKEVKDKPISCEDEKAAAIMKKIPGCGIAHDDGWIKFSFGNSQDDRATYTNIWGGDLSGQAFTISSDIIFNDRWINPMLTPSWIQFMNSVDTASKATWKWQGSQDTLEIPSATEFIKIGDSVYNLKELIEAQKKNEVLEEMLMKQVKVDELFKRGLNGCALTDEQIKHLVSESTKGSLIWPDSNSIFKLVLY